ncbi:hypothetical protein AB3D27_003457 [Vibrio alginolyticus]
MSKIFQLIDSQFIAVEKHSSDCVLMQFSSGVLAVYNPMEFIGFSDISDLVSSNVMDAYVTNEHIVIRFSVEASVHVSLHDADFTGPEAAVYKSNSGSVVVFN